MIEGPAGGPEPGRRFESRGGLMRVIDAGPNPGHRPPFEVDGGLRVPPADLPARVEALRTGLAGVPGVCFTEVELIDPAVLSPLHDPGYVAFLHDTCAELAAARTPDREPALYPSVFPFRPGQRARVPKARMG